jgi:hypothetical protein
VRGIDHHHRQAAKAHIGLDQGVGTDDQLNGSVGDALVHGPFLRRPHGPDQQRTAHAQPLEVGREGLVVLGGQDLGRHHHGRLRTRFHPRQQGRTGHHRLTRPHITLQQPVHSPR